MSADLSIALFCLASYLLGAVPFGLILTRAFAGTDVRAGGSKNIGATNVVRAAGKLAGALTLALDAAKGALPAYLGLRWGGAMVGALAGAAAFFGHVTSPYLGFRGGKGVATGLGVFLVLAPLAAAIACAVYALVFAVTRVSALGSLIALLSAGVAVALRSPTAIVWLYSFIATTVVVRHRENLKELLAKRRS